jgi:hypothetical protein
MLGVLLTLNRVGISGFPFSGEYLYLPLAWSCQRVQFLSLGAISAQLEPWASLLVSLLQPEVYQIPYTALYIKDGGGRV